MNESMFAFLPEEKSSAAWFSGWRSAVTAAHKITHILSSCMTARLFVCVCMCACVTVVSLSKPVVWLLPSCSDTLFPCLMRKCCWYVRLQTHTNTHKHKRPDTQFFSCERWGGCLGCELLLWLSAVSHKLKTCCYLTEKIHREKLDALNSHFIFFVLIVVTKLSELSEFRSYSNSVQIDVKTQQQNLWHCQLSQQN